MRFIEDPPDDVDAFTDAIFVAEGMSVADTLVRRQVRARVEASFRQAAHAAHQYSSDHREAIAASDRCGCFHCGSVFPPVEIHEWVDDGKTAVCPHCGVDAVIGSHSVTSITAAFLSRMHDEWFG